MTAVPGLHVGPALSENSARLLEIRHAAFSRHVPSAYSPEQVRTPPADVDESELRAMIGQRQLFVARDAGRVVGLAGWKGERLRHVSVDPDHIRRGIASRLMAHVEAD